MTSITFVLVAVVVVAVLWQLVSGLLVWENRRFARTRLDCPLPEMGYEPKTEIIVPCKGIELGIRSNLRQFCKQAYNNYSVTFVVEEPDDPVVQVIEKIMAEYPEKARLIYSGKCSVSGQKIHNLQIGIAMLDPETEVIVFADSDAKPQARWLVSMVGIVSTSTPCVATGYRWMVSGKPGWSDCFVSSLNSAIAGSLGYGRFGLIWGGSWAIRRDTFDHLDINHAWFGSLSDDLTATKAVKGAGLRVIYVPMALCISPIDFSPGSAFEFVRRQLLIARKYAPLYWLNGFMLTCVLQIAFWGSLIAALVSSAQSSQFTIMWCVSALLIYATQVVKSYLRQDIGRNRFPQLKKGSQRTRWFDILGFPVQGLLTLGCFVASMVGNTITWRGVTYHIGSGGKIKLLGRHLPNRDRRSLMNMAVSEPESEQDSMAHKKAG